MKKVRYDNYLADMKLYQANPETVLRSRVLFSNIYSSVWERDSLDWKDLTAPEITKRLTSKVRDGSIILFHNAAKHTPEALPGIIEYLLSEGYQIVPISELLLEGEYNIDNTGRMIARSVL